MQDPNEVIGLRPIRMTPLLSAMVIGFSNEFDTRIYPHQKTAILLPVTRADKDRDGLVQVGTTNTFTQK